MTSCSKDGPLRIGDVFLEKYQILKVVGRGAYGWVYRAESLFLSRDVAIKVIERPPGRANETLCRGQREAIVLGKLSKHPNIVDVFDAGMSDDGHLYIVMELLRGYSLERTLRRDGAFNIEEGLEILRDLCSALDFARLEGVVHRDIKPSNIFLQEDGTPKILDFGVAKLAGSEGFQTAPNVVMGTSLYVSPEQLRGLPATHRSDLYALGIVAFQIFYGSHPIFCQEIDSEEFYGFDAESIWRWHLWTETPELDRELADFPEYIARLVDMAMAKHPGQRAANALELGKQASAALSRYKAELSLSSEGRLHRKELKWPSFSDPFRGAETMPLYTGLPLDEATQRVPQPAIPQSVHDEPPADSPHGALSPRRSSQSVGEEPRPFGAESHSPAPDPWQGNSASVSNWRDPPRSSPRFYRLHPAVEAQLPDWPHSPPWILGWRRGAYRIFDTTSSSLRRLQRRWYQHPGVLVPALSAFTGSLVLLGHPLTLGPISVEGVGASGQGQAQPEREEPATNVSRSVSPVISRPSSSPTSEPLPSSPQPSVPRPSPKKPPEARPPSPAPSPTKPSLVSRPAKKEGRTGPKEGEKEERLVPQGQSPSPGEQEVKEASPPRPQSEPTPAAREADALPEEPAEPGSAERKSSDDPSSEVVYPWDDEPEWESPSRDSSPERRNQAR